MQVRRSMVHAKSFFSQVRISEIGLETKMLTAHFHCGGISS